MALRKRCLGVDLGSSAIKVAELALEKDGIRIVRLASAPLDISPTATAAERRSAIAKALRELLRSNRINTKEAVFAIAGQTAFVRRFRLPATTQERLERIIRYEARQQIPFPLERTHLEYQIFPSADGGEVEVLLVAVRIDQIQDFVTLVNRTGLFPQAISITPFALYNYHASQNVDFDTLASHRKTKARKSPFNKLTLFKKKGAAGAGKTEAEQEEEAPIYEEVKAYVHVGAGAVDLAIARHGKQVLLGFTRSVPMAGNEITRAIQDKCRLESFRDAEQVKKSQTRVMTFDFDPELAGEDVNQNACQAATQIIDRLIADLRRSLDFYISQPDGMAVDSIVLSGGQSALPGFPEYIEEKLGLSVSRIEAPGAEWLKMGGGSAGQDASDLSQYAIAIGLGFQGLGLGRVSVDFLPRERKLLRDFPYKVAAVMVAILAGIIVVSSQAGAKYAEIYREQRGAIEGELVQRKLKDDQSKQAQDSRQEIAENYNKMAPALGDRVFWMHFLAGIQEVKPTEVLVDTLVMESDGRVMIIGIVENQNAAAEFTKLLRTMVKDAVEEPRLTQIDRADYPGFDRKVWRFTVNLRVEVERNLLLPENVPPPSVAPAGGMQPAPAHMGPPGVPSGEFLF
jgi:type IV pilus assembly protein PilM